MNVDEGHKRKLEARTSTENLTPQQGSLAREKSLSEQKDTEGLGEAASWRLMSFPKGLLRWRSEIR